jgi:hypothetical protein
VKALTTKAELLRAVGRSNIRPAVRGLGPLADSPKRPKTAEPSMAPTNGLTPAIPGTGSKRYVYFGARGVAWAVWSDARERVPVTWMTEAEWDARGRGVWMTAPAAPD